MGIMSKNENFFKKLWRLLKEPNLILLCTNWFITIAGAVVSIVMCAKGYLSEFSYIVFGITALSLSYSIYTTAKFTPTLQERFRKAIQNNKFIRVFTENYSIRTIVLVIISIVINLAFVIFNTVFAVLTHSLWYGASAVYYFFLSLLKGTVFFVDNRVKKQAKGNNEKILLGQLKNYRGCGIALLVVELAMTSVITLMILQQRPTEYSKIVAITFATYTCYRIVLSVRNVVNAKKINNPQIQCFRNIGLAETTLSLVSLQMALVSTFSDGTTDLRVLNAIVGFVACAFIIGIGVFMITRASAKIKKLKLKEKGD